MSIVVEVVYIICIECIIQSNKTNVVVVDIGYDSFIDVKKYRASKNVQQYLVGVVDRTDTVNVQ